MVVIWENVQEYIVVLHKLYYEGLDIKLFRTHGSYLVLQGLVFLCLYSVISNESH